MLEALKKEDLDEIVAIDAICFPAPWSKEQYLYELEETDEFRKTLANFITKYVN